MALDVTCIPTIREEAVHLRQAAILQAMEERVLAREAADRSAQATSARRDAATKRASSARWPSRLVHAH